MNTPSLLTPTISLIISSGNRYRVSEVFLYEESSLRKAQALRLLAEQSLKGVSTGVGFLGSPEWAIGGALALGLLEGIASNAAAKQGFAQLEESKQLMDSAKRNGIFFPISSIENIDLPHPELWKGLAKRGLAKASPYAHDGASFVLVRTYEGEVAYLAWDKIESYFPNNPVSPFSGQPPEILEIMTNGDDLTRPSGMPLFEWREAVMSTYGISQKGGGYVWDDVTYDTFDAVITAIKNK